MKFTSVVLTREQRDEVEASICDLIVRYEWSLHAIAPMADHVHIVLSAPREGQSLRDAIKAVASRALNRRFEQRPWWAEKGSAKYLWDSGYLRAAVQYVLKQRLS